MTNPLESLKSLIAARTKSEWVGLLREQWTGLRIWIQENGEGAFVLGIVLGLFAIIAYKFLVVVVFFAALAFGLVWYLAPESRANGSAGE